MNGVTPARLHAPFESARGSNAPFTTWWWLGALALSVGASCFPTAASATSLRGCYDELVVRPGHRAADVPLNTEIQLFKVELQHPLSSNQVELLDSSGMPVPLNVVHDGPAVLRLRPSHELAPRATYRIVVKAPAGKVSSPPLWLKGAPHRTQEFGTGVDRDLTPPVITRNEVVVAEPSMWSRLRGDTIAPTRFVVRATDTQDPVPMKLACVGSSEDELFAVQLVDSDREHLGTYPSCAGWSMGDGVWYAAGGAIDLAGNEARGEPHFRSGRRTSDPRLLLPLLLGLPAGVVALALRRRRQRSASQS